MGNLSLLSLMFALLSSTVAWSADPQSWLMGTTEILFVESPDHGLINPSCLERKCLASDALKSKQSGALVGKGGSNPGSSVCKEKLKGEVIVANRLQKSQGFCRFKDGSYASLDGLIK